MTATGVMVSHDSQPASRLCGRPTRAGAKYPSCHRPAGWGTAHPGLGACKLHGGNNPTRHGRYSGIKHEAIRELIEKHEADPDPLNILPELASARALFEDYVSRYNQWADAIIAWHESYRAGAKPMSQERVLALAKMLDEYEALNAEPTDTQQHDLSNARDTVQALASAVDGKPTQILDIADAYRIISEVTKIVERIENIRSKNAMSRPELIRIMAEMWRAVELLVTDTETRDHIRDAWLRIRL